jgi:hypothetical protein
MEKEINFDRVEGNFVHYGLARKRASVILSNVSHVNVAEKPNIVALVMTQYVYSLHVTVRK